MKPRQITKKWLLLALAFNVLAVILGVWLSAWFAVLGIVPPAAGIVFEFYSPARFG